MLFLLSLETKKIQESLKDTFLYNYQAPDTWMIPRIAKMTVLFVVLFTMFYCARAEGLFQALLPGVCYLHRRSGRF